MDITHNVILDISSSHINVAIIIAAARMLLGFCSCSGLLV